MYAQRTPGLFLRCYRNFEGFLVFSLLYKWSPREFRLRRIIAFSRIFWFFSLLYKRSSITVTTSNYRVFEDILVFLLLYEQSSYTVTVPRITAWKSFCFLFSVSNNKQSSRLISHPFFTSHSVYLYIPIPVYSIVYATAHDYTPPPDAHAVSRLTHV